jgi:hypothetical protein
MGTLTKVYMPIITISLNPNSPGIGTTEMIQSIKGQGHQLKDGNIISNTVKKDV